MKKLLLATVTGAAVASGAYLVSNQNESYTSLPQLDYVPADTVFFWSQLEGFPYLKYLDVLPSAFKNTHQVDELLKVMEQGSPSSNELFFINLFKAYSNSLNSSADFANTWGADNEFKLIGYSVGLLPVARAQLANVDTFLQTVKSAADNAGIRYETSQLEGLPVTRFVIEQGSEKVLDLVVSTKGNWVTVTADTPFNTENDLKIALAATQPTKALSQTGRIEQYIQDYQLDGHSVGYLDTTLLVDAITAKDPQSNTTKMLDSLLALSGNQDALNMVRNPECQKDFSDMASNWPAIVSGTQSIDITSQYADVKVSTVFASNDNKVLDAISKTRGFLPAHTKNIGSAMVSLAYGVDASQISPMVNTVWARFASAEFSCQPLVAAQAQSKDANPAALAMMTGMLGSLKGMSLSVLDMDIIEHAENPGMPDFKSLDLLLTVSADDVEALFNIAKSFAPQFASLTLPEDGSAIEMNEYLPPGLELNASLYLALKGQHLALYTGELGEKFANSLTEQTVEANGFMAFSVDSNKFFKSLIKAAEIAGEEMPEEFERFIGQNTQMQINLDVADKGIVTDAEIVIKKL
ncbi:hypothetical protein CWB73_17165 [Pseudoalteromonas phenolica]|uniref:DUF3352 domain-containing protein n=1 Tax=Pseudoalteromonas phenolica TaxID=161398 RepID=A0A5S3YPA5_9GAMM|nr:hypothetical protein [Pseudoalteromonas phenolica]TMP78281.1 hypothetical protein CWB73_17165 [Pseudoalteromonas phenolica]